jgi:hypothetical protein
MFFLALNRRCHTELFPTETFEGLALGVRIADIKWNPQAIQPWLMALAYGCT